MRLLIALAGDDLRGLPGDAGVIYDFHQPGAAAACSVHRNTVLRQSVLLPSNYRQALTQLWG